jgi:hypothetical protein
MSKFLVYDPVYDNNHWCDTKDEAIAAVSAILKEHVIPMDGKTIENAYVPKEILNGELRIFEQVAHVDGFATKKLGACVDYTEEEMKSLLFKRSCMDEQDYQWDKAYDVNLNLLLRKDTNEDNREDNFWGSYSVGRIIACEALEVNVSEDNTDE